MSSYIITEEDKIELSAFCSCSVLQEAFWDSMAAALRKSQWKLPDQRFLAQCIKDGMGYLLYQLFEVKAKHPLFMKYYGRDQRIYKPPLMDMNGLYALSARMKRGEQISDAEIASMGGRTITADEFFGKK